MVNTGHTIGRGRSLEKHKRRAALALCHTFSEYLIRIPGFQHFLIDFRKVKLLIFSKFISHLLLYFILLLARFRRGTSYQSLNAPIFRAQIYKKRKKKRTF